MDAQRLIEEQREKGHALAAKIETAWSKVLKLARASRGNRLNPCWDGGTV